VAAPSNYHRDVDYAIFFCRWATGFEGETIGHQACMYRQMLGHGEAGSDQHGSCHHEESVRAAQESEVDRCLRTGHPYSLSVTVNKSLACDAERQLCRGTCDACVLDKPSVSSVPVSLTVPIHVCVAGSRVL
jgi:hypothetical protein